MNTTDHHLDTLEATAVHETKEAGCDCRCHVETAQYAGHWHAHIAHQRGCTLAAQLNA